MSRHTLLVQAITKFFVGFLCIGLMLFLSAGDIYYWQGWLFMAVLFIPIAVAGFVLCIKNPTLLQKRLNHKEQDMEQRRVVRCSGLLFIAAFVVAGLNWRWQWWVLPEWTTWTSMMVYLLSYAIYGEVLRENAYLSRTIEVEEGQKVIDSGLYGIVRHPMYSATTLLFLSMPLILGSFISFFIMLGYLPLIVIRIKNEERVLSQELKGYNAYKQRVKYRLLPYVW